MKAKVLIACLLAMVGLMACKKIDQNPEYPFTIIVKTVDDSTRVQNVRVEVGLPDEVDGDVSFEGFTDTQGEVDFDYDKDAVFRIRATRGSNPYTSIACSYVHLEPNKRVYKTVYLKPYDPTFKGCALGF